MKFFEVVATIAVLASLWVVFKKMGREGWEGIIPFYNLYTLCEELYGNGFKALLLLIPLYNIFFIFKMNIDLAKGFNKSAGFGIGLVFLSFIFFPILGFGDAVYKDGSKANTGDDFVTETFDKAKGLAEDVKNNAKNGDPLDKINKLKEMKDNGTITEEEYEAKKAELLKKV